MGIPFIVTWGALGFIWLVPDIVGGLPNAKNSLSGENPTLRVVLGALLLIYFVWQISFSSISSMARPHTLFEERIRRSIAPDAPKLHVAVQLFPIDGESGLWNFLKSQGMYLSLYGIPVDSSLPAKLAPVKRLSSVRWHLLSHGHTKFSKYERMLLFKIKMTQY